jgi:hypothetical protein
MFAELSRETRTLIQQEMQLAKAELGQKVSRMARSGALVIGGGLIAYGGLLGIIAGVILVLINLGMIPWVAALVGGVVVAVIGYILIRAGLSGLRQQDLTPRQTLETLKEDAQWLKSQTK